MSVDYGDFKTQESIENLVDVACGVSHILLDMGIAAEGKSSSDDHLGASEASAMGMLGTSLFNATRFYFEGGE